MICVETRHMQAVLKAQINKTDRNDARRAGTARIEKECAVRCLDLGLAGRTTIQGRDPRPVMLYKRLS